MRFKDLSQLKRPEPLTITLGNLPQHILMAKYAKDKAFKISERVGVIFEKSFEWYGFRPLYPSRLNRFRKMC